MNYDEFKNTVKGQIKEHLPEQYQDSDIHFEQVRRNNGKVKDGIVIEMGNNKVVPNIHMNDFFSDYENGRDIADILDEIAEIRVATDVGQDFEISCVTDFDTAKDHILCKLINLERNTEWLFDKPFTQIEDLAAVYYVELDENMTSPINNEILKGYGITVKELHEIALANMERNSHVKLSSLPSFIVGSMMPEMGIEEWGTIVEETMTGAGKIFLLTNDKQENGAAEILRPDVQKIIAEKFGGDYYVLPSSINEVLIAPISEKIILKDMEEIVQDINANVLPESEFLSDHVYMYVAETKELMRGDRAEEEKRQRIEKKREEKNSLKGRLAEKKEKVEENYKKHGNVASRQAELE